MGRFKKTIQGLFLVLAVGLLAVSVLFPAHAIGNGTFDTVHTYVGAVIFKNTFFTGFTGGNGFGWCSGTLVAPRVFLTAGHCTFFLANFGVTPDKLFVSFAANVLQDMPNWLAVASYATHPDFAVTGPSGTILKVLPDKNDVGVVILKNPVSGIGMATLAPLGFLNSFGDLTNVQFSLLGYGVNEQNVLTGDRRITTSGFIDFKDTWVKLDGVPGTFCRFDSGGPSLLSAGGVQYEVGLHSSPLGSFGNCGDSGGYDTRLDTTSAQTFIRSEIAANP